MSRIQLGVGASTHVGAVREVNEDAMLARAPVFVVADGLGGHHAGDVASGIVVEQFGLLVPAAERAGHDLDSGLRTITEALVTCQGRIQAFAEERRTDPDDLWYAGTTVVAALLVDSEHGPAWLVANLGDSRAYRFGEGVLQQVSVDHSLVQQLVDAGMITPEEAIVHPERNVVTKALGGPEEPDPDFFLLPLGATPRLLLCTDGVTTMLADSEIAAALAEEPRAELAARRLVADAVTAGGFDNATAVVVDVLDEGYLRGAR